MDGINKEQAKHVTFDERLAILKDGIETLRFDLIEEQKRLDKYKRYPKADPNTIADMTNTIIRRRKAYKQVLLMAKGLKQANKTMIAEAAIMSKMIEQKRQELRQSKLNK